MEQIRCALFSIVVLVVCGNCSGTQKVVTITDVKYEINPKLVKMDVVIKQTPEGKTLADLDGYLLEDMNNNIYITSTIGRKASTGIYQVLLRTNNLNMCDFFENPDKEKYLKVFFDDLEKFGHMMYSCPVQKQHYYLKDFEIESHKLPSFTLNGDYKVDFAVERKVKSGYTLIFKMTWYATITDK